MLVSSHNKPINQWSSEKNENCGGLVFVLFWGCLFSWGGSCVGFFISRKHVTLRWNTRLFNSLNSLSQLDSGRVNFSFFSLFVLDGRNYISEHKSSSCLSHPPFFPTANVASMVCVCYTNFGLLRAILLSK